MAEFRITDPAKVPEELKCEPDCTVVRCAAAHAKIAAALDEKCEKCDGRGWGVDDSKATLKRFKKFYGDCPRCNGTGQRQIPGVERLVEKEKP